MPGTFGQELEVAEISVEIPLSFEVSATPTNTRVFSAICEVALEIESLYTKTTEGSVTMDIELEVDAIGSLDGSPTMFGEAEIEIEFEMEATPTKYISGYAAINIELEFEASSENIEPDSAELSIILDIIPDGFASAPESGITTGNLITHSENRLLLDGATEVPIVSWELVEESDSGGRTLTLQLARIGDRALIDTATVIDFYIGRRTLGVWDTSTDFLLFKAGDLQSSQYEVSWDNGPSDTFSITALSKMSQFLMKTPETDVVFYDSGLETLTAADFEPVYDTEGRSYPVELNGEAGLTLGYLFDEIFINRCGFSTVRTNVPSFPIRRVDVSFGQSYLEAIKGLFGMFDPVLFPDGADEDELWVVDTTTLIPAGFPTPRSVTVEKAKTISVGLDRGRIDALLVVYTEQKKNYDYTTTRTETLNYPTGTFPNPDYTNTSIVRTYKQYRKFSAPEVVLREELSSTVKTVSNNAYDILISSEVMTYDNQMRVTRRTKTTQERMPNFLGAYTMQSTASEVETFTFKPHPYKRQHYYLKRKEIIESGLIATDASNPQLGETYERALKQAYRSGNLVEDMTTRFGPIKTTTETVFPMRDGTVRTEYQVVDNIAATIIEDVNENRVGDVAINAMSQAQARVIVFDEENELRTTDRMDSLNVGEVPLNLAVPLARRVLRSRKSRGHIVNLITIHFDRSIRRGMVIRAVGRNNESLGNYIILGRRVKGDINGIETTLNAKEV